MKLCYSFATVLLLALSISFVANSPINPISNQSFPIYRPSWSSNGYYFFYGDPEPSVYNISTGQSWGINELIPSCEGNMLIVTSLNQFYCPVEIQDRNLYFELIQFSPSDFSIINETNNTFSVNAIVTLTQSDTYISYLISIFKKEGFNLTTYSLETGQYSCFVSQLESKLEIVTDFIGYGYLYPNNNFNDYAYFYPCSGDGPIPSNISTVEIVFTSGFTNYNHSTIYFGTGPNANEVYFSQAALVDLTGRIYTGAKAELVASKFNDTHFVATFPQGNYWYAGVFTFGPTLNFVLTKQFNLSVLSSSKNFYGSVSAIPGENLEIFVTLSTTSGFIYDLDKNEYTSTFSDFAPFKLGNGSWVNLTMFGYFIQSPGEPTYFIQAYYSIYYVDPEFNDIWTLFVPSSTNSIYGYPYCSLYHFSRNTSTISQFIFSKCPSGLEYPEFLDVDLDSNGEPVVSLFNTDLYIISSTGYQEIKTIKNAAEIALDLNLSSNVGTVVYASAKDFVISKFFISNGTIFNTSSVPLYTDFYNGNAVQKLNQQYYLLASCNLSQATYTVWDAVNQAAVTRVNLQQSFIILVRHGFDENVYQFPISGIVEENSPTVINQLVWGYTNMLYVYNLKGNIVPIELPEEDVLDIISLGYGSFWTYSENALVDIWRYYELQ